VSRYGYRDGRGVSQATKIYACPACLLEKALLDEGARRDRGAVRTKGGRRIRRIKGDSNCLYRAIAFGAQLLIDGIELSYSQETGRAVLLRVRVAELLREDADVKLSNGWTVKHMVLMGSNREGDTAFLKYRQQVMSSGYGGAAEMYMLLKEVRRPIHVFLDEHATGLRKIAAYEPLDAAERRRVPLEVAWQPNVGGASQHYELLMPVDASDKAAALAASQAGGKASEGAGKAGEGAGNDKARARPRARARARPRARARARARVRARARARARPEVEAGVKAE